MVFGQVLELSPEVILRVTTPFWRGAALCEPSRRQAIRILKPWALNLQQDSVSERKSSP